MLIACDYAQTYYIDHQETFTPVIKLNIVRVLLFIAANFDWPLQHDDAKKIFFAWRFI
jgi:hypothetical protein